MRWVPVDQELVTALALEVEPKVKDRQTGEQATDANGMPRWAIAAFLSGEENGNAGMARVTVPAASKPEIAPGQQVRFPGLRVMHWQQDSRSGLAWVADDVVAATASARRSGGGE